jgi:hypothetical protein
MMTQSATETKSVPQQPPAGPMVKVEPPPPPDQGGAIDVFASQANFAGAQRMARALASSSLVPKEYQGDNGIPNVLIAMELASRIGASVFAVIQNIDIIHGRPSWRSTFLIATVNACGKFTPLRFRWEGKQGTDEWGCRAVARDKADGEECIGGLITIALAKAEGWYGKNGSKWKTMPEQMLMYRAAAFWTRVYSPELALGMQTSDETRDVYGENMEDLPQALTPGSPKALEAVLLAPQAPPTPRPTTNGAPASEPKIVEGTKLVEPAKAEAKPASKPTKTEPKVDRHPETGEEVPPPNAGDAWEPPGA